MSLGGMLEHLRANDVHPPLHHLTLWLVVRVLGTGELAVRLPSLIASTALIPLLYRAGRDVYDRRAGIAAAGLATVAPFAVWYADEARMYAFFMLFALLAAWAQVRVLRDGRRRDWLAWAAAAAALVYTQYFALLFVVVQQLGFVVALAARRRNGRRLRALGLPWLGWSAALAVVTAPLMGFAHAQFAANEAAGKGFEQVPSQTGGALAGATSPPGAYEAITNVAWAVLGYHSDATMKAIAALWPLLLLLALALLGRGRSPRTLLLAACAILPAAVLFGLGQLKPFVFEVRYFVGAVPLALLLLARAATSWTVRPAPAFAACGVAAVAMAAGLADQQLNGSNPRVYDFEGAVHAVEARARPGDVLVYEPPYLGQVIAYYDRDRIRARPLGSRPPEPRRGRRVFVLASFLDKPQFRQATEQAVRRLDRRHRLVWRDSRPQIRIWEFR
jgi:4-amino-4-deoxy-L-arabinose transferase-like glycosyltransferase